MGICCGTCYAACYEGDRPLCRMVGAACPGTVGHGWWSQNQEREEDVYCTLYSVSNLLSLSSSICWTYLGNSATGIALRPGTADVIQYFWKSMCIPGYCDYQCWRRFHSSLCLVQCYLPHFCPSLPSITGAANEKRSSKMGQRVADRYLKLPAVQLLPFSSCFLSSSWTQRETVVLLCVHAYVVSSYNSTAWRKPERGFSSKGLLY